MTKDEIIKMAIKSGAREAVRGVIIDDQDSVFRFYRAVRNKALEDAAGVSDSKARFYIDQSQRLEQTGIGLDAKAATVGQYACQDTSNDIRAMKDAE